MADGSNRKENCFSVELKLLEAEYERSKLQVFQDTFFCKRSIVELELLCKNEQLMKNVRVNNKLREHECRLKEQVESLSTELENVTSQQQTTQKTLQDEQIQHLLEKKELEDRMKSEMDGKIEKYRATSSNKENLLKREIKTWKDKQIQASKDAEELRRELKKKEVSMKTKGIQARTDVNNASTMTQVDSQKSDASTQVQTSALMSELFQGSNGQEIGGDLQNGNASDNGKKDVVKADGKLNNQRGRKKAEPRKDQHKYDRGRKAKDKTVQDSNKEQEDDKFGKKENEGKQKSPQKEKVLRNHNVTYERNSSTLKGKQAAKTQRDSNTLREEQREILEVCNARGLSIASGASEEGDVPFQDYKTPGKSHKSPETGKNPDTSEDKPGMKVQEEDVSSVKKGRGEIVREVLQHAVVEDIANRRELESGEEGKEKLKNDDLQDHEKKFEKKPSQKQIPESLNPGTEEQKILSIDEDNDFFVDLSEEQKQLTEDNKKVETSSKDKWDEEFSGVQEQDKKKLKSAKEKGSQRRVTSTEDKSSPAEGNAIEQRSAHEMTDQGSRRVLRRRAKKIKLKPNVIDGETVAKKSKAGVECQKGSEPAISKTSSPEVNPFPRDIEMSSCEIDRPGVDKSRLSRATTVHKPLDGTSQQPETEVLEGLSNGTSAHGQLFRNQRSDKGKLILSDNSIKTVEESLSDHEKPSHSEKCQSGPEINNEKEKDDLPSKNRNKRHTAQELQAVDDVIKSKKQQDVGTTDRDSNTQLSCQANEQNSRDTGRSRKNGQGPTESGGKGKIVWGTKENAQGGKQKVIKKRKPTLRVREVSTLSEKQCGSTCTTNTENPSILDCTKKRKTLFNSRENSLLVQVPDVQISFVNKTLSRSRANAGIPPSLSAFMRSFIAPKLKKSS